MSKGDRHMGKKGSRGKKILVGACLGIIVAAGMGIFLFIPWGMPHGEEYFKPLGERALQADETGQWWYLRGLYRRLEATTDTFGGWDKEMMPFWRYGIAFGAYGMPSLALIDPENISNVNYYLEIMIKKMKSKKVWKDWVELGFGEDPITDQNIMYKGHLNLMYGLYQLITGDDQFSREYTWLTQQIVREARKNHSEGIYEGINCQPNMYYVQCNAIGLMSLHIYDKLYGTDYTQKEVRWVVRYIRENLTDPETGLYYTAYFPIQDATEKVLSGYTNAWTMVFLRPFDPEYNEKLYPVWKKTFVNEIGPYAFVSEVPGQGPGSFSTMFGLWAAKEFGDVELFTKLRNGIDKKGKLEKDPESGAMVYAEIDNPLANGPVLGAKLHLGWNILLDHAWPAYQKPMTIPDVSAMSWKDLLPQEIQELEHGLDG
jgi:hypothetical protein